MQKSDNNQQATSAHRKVRSSTTLNRKYVKRPARQSDVIVRVKRSPKVTRFGEESGMAQPVAAMMNSQDAGLEQAIKQAEMHPLQKRANERMKIRVTSAPTVEMPRPTAKELKDQAIQKALAAAAKTDTKETKSTKKSKHSSLRKGTKVHFGFGRVMLAMTCAASAVFAIVYFVNLNMPDISLRVAAMQTGIEASYPNYVPRDYALSDITSESGKITLNFKNAGTGDAFSIVEETSSWDSNALLTNYVQDSYGDNYTVIKEQGLTIYISGSSDACWVNGGVVYKLKTTAGSLTKKQIKSIATSL